MNNLVKSILIFFLISLNNFGAISQIYQNNDQIIKGSDSSIFEELFDTLPFKTFYNINEALDKRDDVYSLSLSNHNLQTIPIEILLLKNLKVLDISYNELDTLPNFLSELKNLEVLDCRNNKLNNINNNICSLYNLKKIDLWGNNLHALPACLGHLKLKELNVGMNLFSFIPPCIYNIGSMEKLELSNNYIVYVSDSINFLKNLLRLDLSNNKIFHLENAIKNLTHLKFLLIDGNYLTLSEINCIKKNCQEHQFLLVNKLSINLFFSE